MSLKVSRCLLAGLLITFFLGQLPANAQQSNNCPPVSNNPLLMAELCSGPSMIGPLPAVARTNATKPAENLLTFTADEINSITLDESPAIRPGDFLVYEANRRDFFLYIQLSNGKEIVVEPLTKEDAEDISVVWRKGRIRLDYPETLNSRIIRHRVVPLHQGGTALLLRDLKIDGKRAQIFKLEKSQPGAPKPKPFEPPMSYPPDVPVMTASVTMPNLFSKEPQAGFLAPHLPAFSMQPMMMFQTDTGTTSDPNHYKFTGKELDDESGLYYFGARHYSPALGRFMQPDPTIISQQRMLNPQGWNMYAYALNNPTTLTDPDGREAGYQYPQYGVMVAPNEAGFVKSDHPIRDTLIVGGATVTALAAPAAGPLVRGLVGVGAAYASTPGGQQILNEAAETIANPLPTPSLTSAFGIGKVESVYEGFSVGRLANGAEVAAKFSTEGETTTVSVLGAFNATDSKSLSGTLSAIYNGAKSVATQQGSSKVTIQAVGVINKDLAARLTKQGFTKTMVPVGKEKVEAFQKTFNIKKAAD